MMMTLLRVDFFFHHILNSMNELLWFSLRMCIISKRVSISSSFSLSRELIKFYVEYIYERSKAERNILLMMLLSDCVGCGYALSKIHHDFMPIIFPNCSRLSLKLIKLMEITN